MPWLALHVPVGAAPALADSAAPATALTVPGTHVVDGIAWSSSGSLVVPSLAQTPQNPDSKHRDVIGYEAHDGETLRALASQFGLSVNTLIWSNPKAVDRLTEGEVIEIPPVDGVLVKVAATDSVASLARQFRAEQDAIIQFNFLRHPQSLPVGSFLMIPYGVGPEAPSAPAPAPRVISTAHQQWPIDPIYSPGVGSVYPFGQCTWYVNSRRSAPWGGNAWQWYGRAQAFGRPEGATPRVGAIMVTWESPYWGHVAYVEQVYPDGSWLVSEMNYYGSPGGGWGRVSYRHVVAGTIPLIGFIY